MDKVSVGCLVYLIVVYAKLEMIKRTEIDSKYLWQNTNNVIISDILPLNIIFNKMITHNIEMKKYNQLKTLLNSCPN